MSNEVLDLFGNPWVDKPRRRGRPRHEVSEKTRKRVSMLVALGWGNQRIADTIGITLPTLHKYYFYEVGQRQTARDQLEARRLELVWQLAEAGNVGAHREFARLLERNDRMESERELGSQPNRSVVPAATDRLGKKALNMQLAMDADADLMAELEEEASQNARH
ncbi:hypothetical protein D5400_12575 [Georhizobium profundi]|uniref:Uncharacterized protein n=1 Tax=Georhizobium profundi TaxID=2341112 RepID=A0A3S9B4V0_9HYPH|nr:hypothetical protein [Georhizobium profundi]AZN71998.1 hypothetical protein D5400_12575 [Georhizobium profundi]